MTINRTHLMESALQALTRDIGSLKEYIKDTTNFKAIVDDNKSLFGAIQSKQNSRIFEYNSYIISLYGFFEKFIEAVLEEYLKELSSIHVDYSALPKSITDINVKKNCELLLTTHLPKNKYIKPFEVIENLYHNLKYNCPKLTVEAFSQHTSNFNISTIIEIFKSIDLKDLLKQICTYEPLNTYFIDREVDTDKGSLKHLYGNIDDLVLRRNIIAHGEPTDDILSSDVMLDLCDFIVLFCQSLTVYLKDQLYMKQSDLLQHSLSIEGVFKKNILCINMPQVKLTKDSKILVERYEKPKMIVANINKMQVDHETVEVLDPAIHQKVGLELDTEINQKNKFYLFEYADD